jgi:orotate phosphoribosyltransferase
MMEIVELAITLNRCEEIKAVLKSNLPFSSIHEFKELLNLQSQKEELK